MCASEKSWFCNLNPSSSSNKNLGASDCFMDIPVSLYTIVTSKECVVKTTNRIHRFWRASIAFFHCKALCFASSNDKTFFGYARENNQIRSIRGAKEMHEVVGNISYPLIWSWRSKPMLSYSKQAEKESRSNAPSFLGPNHFGMIRNKEETMGKNYNFTNSNPLGEQNCKQLNMVSNNIMFSVMIFTDFELQPKLLNVQSTTILSLEQWTSTMLSGLFVPKDRKVDKQLIRVDNLSLRTGKWTYSANLEMRRAHDLDVKVIRAVRPDYIPFNHQI